MKPGVALNTLIAERVFGFNLGKYDNPADENIMTFDRLPDYSTDIAAAWLVVNHLMTKQIHLELSTVGSANKKEWWAQFKDFIGQGIGSEYGSSPAEAICKAALIALDSNKKA